ncbi:hypothetical protein CEXT_361011, partial [Caerostris extrusa]
SRIFSRNPSAKSNPRLFHALPDFRDSPTQEVFTGSPDMLHCLTSTNVLGNWKIAL